MNRRHFLSAILVAGIAPAIVRSDSLMRVIARDTTVISTGDFLTINEARAREGLPKIEDEEIYLPQRVVIPVSIGLGAMWVGDGHVLVEHAPIIHTITVELRPGETVNDAIRRKFRSQPEAWLVEKETK